MLLGFVGMRLGSSYSDTLDAKERSADDGKRFLAWDRCMANKLFRIGGGLGEDGAGSDRAGGLADDGKRFCDGRCSGVCFFNEKGGGLEEGGLQIRPGRRRADSFCVFVLSVFFSSVSGGSFFSFFVFSVVSGVPKEVVFGHFL